MKDETVLLAFGDAPPASAGRLFVGHPHLQPAGVELPWRYLRLGALTPGICATDTIWPLEPVAPWQGRRPAMPDQIFMALTSPVAGEEENFDRWYNEVHLPELLRGVPQFAAARRYRRHPDAPGQRWSHVTLYEVVASKPDWMPEAMAQARGTLSPLESVAAGHVGWLWSAAD